MEAKWTQAQDLILREAFARYGADGVGLAAKKVGKSHESARKRALRLSLFKIGEARRVPWSDDEQAFMRAEWDHDLSAKANCRLLATKMARSYDGLLHQANRMGLISSGPPEEFGTGAKVEEHAEACLREGGFPTAILTNQGTVWVYPTQRVAA